MTCRARLGLLWALLGAAVLAAAVVPPVPQDLRYHRMADDRTLWGIPNALNVLSSAPFILVGALGLWSLRPRRPHGRPQFVEACERWPYGVFFAGLGLTGRFAAVVGGDGVSATKPDPASVAHVVRVVGIQPDELWMVGDSATDVATGRGAEAHTVGCAWGLRGAGELRAAGAEFIVDHPRQIAPLIGCA